MAVDESRFALQICDSLLTVLLQAARPRHAKADSNARRQIFWL